MISSIYSISKPGILNVLEHIACCFILGFFLAVLSQTYSSSLIVTKKAAEQPGMLTFKFRLDIPDATNASTPPNLDTATERYIANNYNKIKNQNQNQLLQ